MSAVFRQKSFTSQNQVGKLYLVPTPIGNLLDMTYRAVEVLREVDLIAAEDTRNTQKLLNHYAIDTHQEALHEHNWKGKVPKLIAALREGKSIAQVSDAGMPSISDPGHELVCAALEEGISVVALPGASAGITALIASGISPQPHVFYGFLARKRREQIRFFEDKKAYPETQIFYESPHRLTETLSNLIEVYGNRQVVLARELTKLHEEYQRGLAKELLESLKENPVKGECLLIVAGNTEKGLVKYDKTPIEEVVERIGSGEKPNEAIKRVAQERKINRQELYAEYHDF